MSRAAGFSQLSPPPPSTASRHRRVGRESAVRSNVLEDLLDHGDHMRILNGVDLAAAVASTTDDARQSKLRQVLARGSNAHAGSSRQRAHVVFALGGQGNEVQTYGSGKQREGPCSNVQLWTSRLRDHEDIVSLRLAATIRTTTPELLVLDV